MPCYEYVCEICGKEIEVVQKYNDFAPKCCGDEMKRNISLSSFVLKGGGWCNSGYSKVPDKKEKIKNI